MESTVPAAELLLKRQILKDSLPTLKRSGQAYSSTICPKTFKEKSRVAKRIEIFFIFQNY
jgi:hypothetical protein